MLSSTSSPLLDFPEEVLLGIIEQVEEKKDLITLTQVNDRLRALAEPVLHRDILIRNDKKAGEFLVAACNDRVKHVRNLAVCFTEEEDEEGITDKVNGSFDGLYQLKHLRLETPCCNNTPWQRWIGPGVRRPWTSACRINFFAYFDASFQHISPHSWSQLRSINLHIHGYNDGNSDMRYDLGPSSAVFHHSTLREITLQCSDLGPDLVAYLGEFDDRKGTTPLKRLTFIECNISNSALHSILSMPRALEYLDVGERQHHFHNPGFDNLARDPTAFLKALHIQQHSLRTLKHTACGSSRFRLPLEQLHFDHFDRQDMRNLQALETLEVGANSILSRWICMPGALPESLTTIQDRRQSGALFHDSGFDIIAHDLHLYRTPPSLKTLDLIFQDTRPDGVSTRMNHWIGEQETRTLHPDMFSKMLYRAYGMGIIDNRSIRIRIYAVGEAKWIPPYLYGEEGPALHLFFDSAVDVPNDPKIVEACIDEAMASLPENYVRMDGPFEKWGKVDEYGEVHPLVH